MTYWWALCSWSRL